MKYAIFMSLFMSLSTLGIVGMIYSMEEGKEPSYAYEFQAVLDDPGTTAWTLNNKPDNRPDTHWVFRAYNGQNPNPMPPQFKKAQQVSASRSTY